MAAALIHFDPKQKARLARRARQRGRSFSQEVRSAVDLYLDLPVQNEQELALLARAARESADRTVRRLDDTILYVNRTLKAMGKHK